MSTQVIPFLFGPDDGAERRFATPFSEVIEIDGDTYSVPAVDGAASKVAHKVHTYVLAAANGRLTYCYRGEHMVEEVTHMGIKKHGVGEPIIDDDQTDDLSKQASADWTSSDEEGLHDENED